MSQLQLIKEIFERAQKNPNNYHQIKYSQVKTIIKFWEDPYQCKKCGIYHWQYEDCPPFGCALGCNRCNNLEHKGTVCNNTTYIYNITFECGCYPKSVREQRVLADSQISSHCCVCHKPQRIWEMQISKDQRRARCEECQEKSKDGRNITPPISPKLIKRNMYEELDEDLANIMDIDPKEECSEQTMTTEEIKSKRVKCICWSGAKGNYCKKHDHKPDIFGDRCLNCEKLPKRELKEQIPKLNNDLNLSCSLCNQYIHWRGTKAKCQAGYYYCQECYKKVGIKMDDEDYIDDEVKRCHLHISCLLFQSKEARRRYNNLDEQTLIELHNSLFCKDLKECTCQTCNKRGTLWHNGCETLCKYCDKVQKLERDQQNDQFFLRMANRIITEKTGIITAPGTIEKDKKVSQELPETLEKDEKPFETHDLNIVDEPFLTHDLKLVISYTKYEKLKLQLEQQKRENEYIRDHYQNKLKEQDDQFSKQLDEIQIRVKQLNERSDQMTKIIESKDNRIQELNNTIAQQNQQIEKINEVNEMNQTYSKIIDQLNNQINTGNQYLFMANANIDNAVNEQNSATTTPFLGPIYDPEFANENLEKLFNQKCKLDEYILKEKQAEETLKKVESQLINIDDIMPNWRVQDGIINNNTVTPMEIEIENEFDRKYSDLIDLIDLDY